MCIRDRVSTQSTWENLFIGMRQTVLWITAFACFFALCAANREDLTLKDALKAELSLKGMPSTWSMDIEGSKFANYTIRKLRDTLASIEQPEDRGVDYIMDEASKMNSDLLQMAIPTDFDGRTVWPDCVQPIRSQGRCGSGYAFGATGSVEDRFCFQSEGKIKIRLSPQDLIDCDWDDSGCKAGWPSNAWYWIRDFGVPTEECYPYEGTAYGCRGTCADGSKMAVWKVKTVRGYNTLDDVKLDIMTKGPLETTFRVYTDFYAYTSGIYIPQSVQLVGFHSVKVIGWGVSNGTSYWLAQNSFGEDWGENGYFRIKAGTCEFDLMVRFVGGDPLLTQEDN
eukprot:TRINITY_DN4418_c0_g2_i1.p1 TRINITY_DN4418_c0_g2~~TRINITY_DN4418_c0_g2_i1.p1  ORF type:complete len:338 (-),score=58.81 TRINITY_DN4418_c0_g2_i1:77-1090(-)